MLKHFFRFKLVGSNMNRHNIFSSKDVFKANIKFCYLTTLENSGKIPCLIPDKQSTLSKCTKIFIFRGISWQLLQWGEPPHLSALVWYLVCPEVTSSILMWIIAFITYCAVASPESAGCFFPDTYQGNVQTLHTAVFWWRITRGYRWYNWNIWYVVYWVYRWCIWNR